jgi:hypothetical protein
MTSNSGNYDPTEDKAIVEVCKVQKAVRRYGANCSVAFDDPVTMAVIAHIYGGWPELCAECDAEDFRREFVRTWAAYFRQGVKHFGHLPGRSEITNRSNGFCEHIPPSKLIGDPEKANTVQKTRQAINAMISKPKLKPGKSGSARMEYYACREEVEALLAEGYHVFDIYEYMKKQGRVTCSYGIFCDNARRGR